MSKFKNMRIKTRMLIAFMFVAVIMVCTFTIAVVDVNSTVSTSEDVVTRVIDPLDWLLHARVLIESLKVDGRDVLIETDPQRQSEMLATSIEKLPLIRGSLLSYYETIDDSWDECFRLYAELSTSLDVYENNMAVFRNKVIRGDVDAGLFLAERLSPVSDQSLDLMAQLNGVRLEVGRGFIEDSNNSSRITLYWLIAISIVGLALTIFSGVFLSISISKPILKCVDIMTQAGNGDFTVRLPSDYGAEIGQLFSSCNILIDISCSSVTNL